MNPSVRLAFVGDLTVDRYVKQKKTVLGGSSLNSAVWARRLGAHASIIAAVGNDQSGKHYRAMLARERIDASRVHVFPGKTSSIDIIIEKGGERSYGNWDPGVLTHVHLGPEDFRFLLTHDAAALTIYGPTRHLVAEYASGWSARGKKPFLLVDVDDLSQFDKNIDVVATYADGFDAVKAGLDKDADEKLIEQLHEFSRQTNTLVVITLGAFGSLAVKGESVAVAPSVVQTAVDTTGAGDAFVAGFLVALVQTGRVKDALVAGNAVAAKAVTKLGAY